MKTGDMVIYKGLVDPELNVKLEGGEELHKMHVWDEKQELVFWWEPLPAMIEGRVYRFGYELFHNGRLMAKDRAARFLTIEELHGLILVLVRDVFC